MEFNAAIDKLQAFLEKYKKEELKFTDAKLDDGVTIVRFPSDAPTVGEPLTVITEQGELPAPDADIVLEDGTQIKVVNGLIAEVVPAEAAPEKGAAPAGETVAAPMAAPTQSPKMIVETITKENHFTKEVEDSYNGKFEAIEKENADLKATIEVLEAKFNEVVELVQVIGSKPSEAPVEKKKTFNAAEFRKAFRADLDKL